MTTNEYESARVGIVWLPVDESSEFAYVEDCDIMTDDHFFAVLRRLGQNPDALPMLPDGAYSMGYLPDGRPAMFIRPTGTAPNGMDDVRVSLGDDLTWYCLRPILGADPGEIEGHR